MKYSELRAKGTPGGWVVRTFPDGSDCFVEGPRKVGAAYGAEVLGDGYSEKAADARLIAHWSRHFDRLLEALKAQSTGEIDGVLCWCPVRERDEFDAEQTRKDFTEPGRCARDTFKHSPACEKARAALKSAEED